MEETVYNILTCDDEQIMIDSLQFIISKNFEGQVKLFSALSGTEALEVVNKNKIDIIFMDINMSGMNGLDTIRCITNLNTDVVIIVLSAFDKFQYAQEAMNLGAYKYITKPVNRNVVIQTVRNAMNLVDDKRERSGGGKELQKKLDIVSPMVESDFIYSCIFNGEKKEDLSTYMQYFGIQLKKYFFMCIEIPRFDSANQGETYSKIRNLLQQKFMCIMGSFMVNRIIVFIPFQEQGEEEELQTIFMASTMSAYKALTFNIAQGIRCGVSRVGENLDEVTNYYNEAVLALNTTSPNGEILFADNITKPVSGAEKAEEMKSRIFNRLKIGDGAGVRYLAKMFVTKLYEDTKEDFKIKNKIFELLIRARDMTKEINTAFDISGFDDIFMNLAVISDNEKMSEYLGEKLLECSCAVNASREQKENPLIQKVCNYIESNMDKDISLDDASAVAGVSSFYLSKLFKEETGETFVNYLTEKRLEKAKAMLGNKSYSIKEVAACCGYNDQNYFSRLFKNKFGISPTDFKTMI